MDALTEQAGLIDRIALQLASGGTGVVQFETHVSRVLVAGGHAFKFKKPLRLPFLDAATLEARRFLCEEECRLNRRLAAGMYIDVVAVTGDIAHPVLGGAGKAVEYAVRMHAFEQQALWGCRIAHGLLGDADADRLAQALARFHIEAPRAPADAGWGSVAAIAAGFLGTLAELAELSGLVAGAGGVQRLRFLRQWETHERARLDARFRLRKAQGMVRECHGDLHCDKIKHSGLQRKTPGRRLMAGVRA